MISNANDVKTLVLVKTNIGGWIFDAFLRVDHESKLRITEHPVQTGAAITDHAYLEPRVLTMEVGMSDAARSLIPGQFSSDRCRSVTAYKVLRELQQQRIPIQVLTRLGIYQNMMIESISAPDDYRTLHALKASVVMREILVAQVKTVKISSRPQITGSTNKGSVEPVKQNESVAYQKWGEVWPAR